MSSIPIHTVETLPVDGVDTVRVPLIGQTLCAGFPSPADDFVEGVLDLPRWLVPNPPATFLMQVRGESMRGAGIHDRDLACVDRSLTPGDGSVVVAVVDGLLSCKRYRISGNRAHLAFDSLELPAFAVEEFGEVEIWGVLRFSIRWHVAHGRLS